jgi:hypothetical protein
MMSAYRDNRAICPDSGPALWSYADECLARVLGLPDANSAALHVERVLTPDYTPFDGPDLESLSDGGENGGDGNVVNVTADTDLETVTDDAGKSDAVSVVNAPVLALPEAGGRGDGKADYPRFHPMKGFSKVQRKIWNWLDEHAAEVNHKYPTQRDVAEAVGTTHPTAGKYLKQWRMHNNITTPDFYQDQAS